MLTITVISEEEPSATEIFTDDAWILARPCTWPGRGGGTCQPRSRAVNASVSILAAPGGAVAVRSLRSSCTLRPGPARWNPTTQSTNTGSTGGVHILSAMRVVRLWGVCSAGGTGKGNGGRITLNSATGG